MVSAGEGATGEGGSLELNDNSSLGQGCASDEGWDVGMGGLAEACAVFMYVVRSCA